EGQVRHGGGRSARSGADSISSDMTAPIRRRRRSRARAMALRLPSRRAVVSALLALLLATCTYTGYRVLKAIHAIDPRAGLGDIVGLAGNQENIPGTLAYKLKHGQRVNILLLGYGGAGHDGAYLTDSIMVISVQGADRVAMTSIPRDT